MSRPSPFLRPGRASREPTQKRRGPTPKGWLGLFMSEFEPGQDVAEVDTLASNGVSAEDKVTGFRIRTTPEDFQVIEEPLYETTGEGNHTFLFVEKRGRTTEQVARDLSRQSGVSQRDVGYAGRKDRHAVTRQWFSLEGVEPDHALDFEIEGARIIQAQRHPHKIKTGHLRANHFEIVLRGDNPVDSDALSKRVTDLIERGMPNRYGEQRFGRHGDNAAQARKMLDDSRPPRDRRAARFLVSALQSEVFNAVLEARIDAFDDVLLGDVARVEESGGLFWVDDLERERSRAKEFEISATGPIFGSKMRVPRDEAAALEKEIYGRFGIPELGTLKWPKGIRARGTRRPLRVRPEGLSLEALENGTDLILRCTLPPGAYVTALMESLVGDVIDASRSRPVAQVQD
jgi:tRNA pseudouridine13 synthase